MLLATLLCFGAATPELQPKTYSSASGLWSLDVEPTTRAGTKDADYVLTGATKEAWRKRLPFALWDAVVTNDGRVAGYAYSGAEVDAIDGGSLRVVILSPKGEVLLDEAHPRSASHFMHGSAEPHASGIFLVEELGRCVVRVADEDLNRRCNEWWTYDLHTGKPLARIRPKEKLGLWNGERDVSTNAVGFELGVRPVTGTPLVLVQWWRYDMQVAPSASGTLFAVLDPDLNAVWKLELPTDYSMSDDEDAEDRLRDEIWKNGAILSTVTSKQFELRHVASGERVTYSVEPSADGKYHVQEIARRPYTVEASAAETAIPVVQPKLLREVALMASNASQTEIRDIEVFAFDGPERLRFARSEPDGGTSLVAVDTTGRVLRMTKTEPITVGDKRRLSWFPLGSPRWVAVEVSATPGTTARAWFVDELTGRITPIPDFPGQGVEALASLGRDVFVFATTWQFKYTQTEELVALDFAGKVLWKIETNLQNSEDPTQIFTLEDLTVTTDNRVVVLDNICKRIQIFDATGAFVAMIDLAKALGREPNYPTQLEPDVAGGFLFKDFNGDPPLWRLASDGTPHAKLDPRRPDGSSTRAYRDEAKVSPSGRVWTTDGSVLLRLDDAGIVDLVLGEEAHPDRLQEPGSCAVDSTFGRILVHDGRTRAVHVFDADGRRFSVCRPSPSEIDDFDFPLEMSTTAGGEVFAADSPYTNQYLHFGADGESLGVQSMRALNLAFCPDSSGYWGASESVLVRSTGAKKASVRIEKRPDGQWFRAIEEIRVAPDSSVAVLDGGESAGPFGERAESESAVALFSATGDPLRTLLLPKGCAPSNLAYTTGWILVDDWDRVFLVDARGGSARQLDLRSWISEEDGATYGFSPDGREIWAVTGRDCRLLRFARPE